MQRNQIENGILFLQSLITGPHNYYLIKDFDKETVPEIFYSFSPNGPAPENLEQQEVDNGIQNYGLYIGFNSIHFKIEEEIITFRYDFQNIPTPKYFANIDFVNSFFGELILMWQKLMVANINKLSLEENYESNNLILRSLGNQLHTLMHHAIELKIENQKNILNLVIALTNLRIYIHSLLIDKINVKREVFSILSELNDDHHQSLYLVLLDRFKITDTNFDEKVKPDIEKTNLNVTVAEFGYLLGLLFRNEWFARGTNFTNIAKNISSIFLTKEGKKISSTQLIKHKTLSKDNLQSLDSIHKKLDNLLDQYLTESKNIITKG